MQQEDPNYGRHPEEPGLTRLPVGMSAQEERTWSMLAHLSVLLNIVTGIGGPIAALVVWLVYKDRSQRVGFHALQSLWYQVAWIVILMVGWFITGILTLVFIGLLLIPVMLIASLVPLIHQCYAAYKVNQGVDYRYPVIADMVDRNRRFSEGLSVGASAHGGLYHHGGSSGHWSSSDAGSSTDDIYESGGSDWGGATTETWSSSGGGGSDSGGGGGDSGGGGGGSD